MSQYTVGVIGTGPEPANATYGESVATSYRHGNGYRKLPASDPVTCCDVVRENAGASDDETDRMPC